MAISLLYSHGLHSDVVEWEIVIMDVQPTNMQQTPWWNHVNTNQKCDQHLVESMPWRILMVMQHGTSKVYIIKWLVSAYQAL